MRKTYLKPPTTSISGLSVNLSESFDLYHKNVKAILDTLRDEIVQNLLAGKRVNIFGLGTLEPHATKERIGRNPKTGEKIQISARRRIAFKVSKNLKEQL